MHVSEEKPHSEAALLVSLPERLTIGEAAQFQRTLHDALAGGRSIAIDGAQVTEIDTAGLQLLIGLCRLPAAGAARCEWHGVSEPLRRFAQLLGVHEHLRLPAVAAGNDCNACV